MTGIHAALLLALCFGISFGVNEVTRPHFDYAMTQNDRLQVTGSLKLEVDGVTHQLDLASSQLIRGSANRLLGSAIPVRAMWLRSAELEAQNDPDFELFADLSAVQAALDPNTRSLDALTGVELPVITTPPGSTLRSRLRVPGAPAHAAISQGSVTLREVTPVPNAQAGAPAFRASGDLNLLLADGAGQRPVRGHFEVSLMWY